MSARLLAISLAFLAASASVLAQEAPDAGYQAWLAAYDAADARTGSTGSLRDALTESSRERWRMQELAQSCRDRVSALESAVFKADFLRREHELAQREAERLSQQKDQRYEEMMERAEAQQRQKDAEVSALSDDIVARQGPHDAESQRLDEWDARIDAWRIQVDAWFARVDAMSKDEGPAYDAYLAAFYEYKAEADRFSADVAAYNLAIVPWNAGNDQLKADYIRLSALSVEAEDAWTARLQEIENFMLEEGKPVLAAQELASKKEREWAEAAGKLADLEAEQADESAELAALVNAANALLGVVTEALNAPPPTAASIAVAAAEAAAAPYVARSEETAQAVAVAPPSAASGASALQNRILVLPPAQQADNPAAASAEALRAQLQAEALATQYAPVPEVTATPVAAADSVSLARAPAGFLGPAPLSYSGVFDDGSAAIVLTDEMLAAVYDPRVFISDAEYQRALAVQGRCAGLVPKLEAEIARLRQQRDKTTGYSAEFEAVRAEIATGALREAFGTYSAAFKYARTSGQLASLTAEQSEKIERAFDLMKLGLAPLHADLTKEEQERRNVEFKALEDGAALLAGLAGAASGNAEVAALLDGAGNVMKSYCEVTRYRANPVPAAQPEWEKMGARVKLGIDVAANFVPVIALGVAVEGTGERAAQWIITQEAVNSLSAALKSTDEAIIYLADQLTRRQLELDKAAATIENYQAVDPNRRRAFHIR